MIGFPLFWEISLQGYHKGMDGSRYRAIPIYKEGFLAAVATPLYRFFFKTDIPHWIMFGVAFIAGPMNYMAYPLTLPLLIYILLMGWFPNVINDEFRGYYDLVLGASFLLVGTFITFLEILTRLLDREYLHQNHAFLRPYLIVSGALGLLWPLSIHYGVYDGKLLFFSADFFRGPYIFELLVLFPSLRLLMGLSWLLAIRYEYEPVRLVPSGSGSSGGSDGENAQKLPPTGSVIKAKSGPKVDPQALPTEKERQALLWQIKEKLVLPQKVMEEIADLILLLRHYQAYYKAFGTEMPKGILLVGPPGTGKTSVARFIAEHSGLAFITAKPDELRSKWLGESAQRVASLFELARENAPAVVFIDEIESVFPLRGQHNEVDHIVGQVLQEVEGIHSQPGGPPVILVGATNHPSSLDPAIISRMGVVLEIPLPDTEARKRILEILLKDKDLDPTVDLDALARLTRNFSGRDLRTLVTGAAKRAFTQGRTKLSQEDLLAQLSLIRPGVDFQ